MHTWYYLGRNSNAIYNFWSWTKKSKELPQLKTKDYEKENLPESETMYCLKVLRATNISGNSYRHILLLKHVGTTAATQKPYSLTSQLGTSK
jgi:hypothetical protein